MIWNSGCGVLCVLLQSKPSLTLKLSVKWWLEGMWRPTQLQQLLLREREQLMLQVAVVLMSRKSLMRMDCSRPGLLRRKSAGARSLFVAEHPLMMSATAQEAGTCKRSITTCCISLWSLFLVEDCILPSIFHHKPEISLIRNRNQIDPAFKLMTRSSATSVGVCWESTTSSTRISWKHLKLIGHAY